MTDNELTTKARSIARCMTYNDDDHPLNRSRTAAAEIERLFPPPPVHQEEEK